MTGVWERDFVKRIDAVGYAAIKTPASGSRTDRPLPDVIAGKPATTVYGGDWSCLSNAMAVEHKSGKDTTLYVDGEEVEDLVTFADRFGATAYLAARFTDQATPKHHFIVAPDDARETDEGNYGLPVEDIRERSTYILEVDGNDETHLVEVAQ